MLWVWWCWVTALMCSATVLSGHATARSRWWPALGEHMHTQGVSVPTGHPAEVHVIGPVLSWQQLGGSCTVSCHAWPKRAPVSYFGAAHALLIKGSWHYKGNLVLPLQQIGGWYLLPTEQSLVTVDRQALSMLRCP